MNVASSELIVDQVNNTDCLTDKECHHLGPMSVDSPVVSDANNHVNGRHGGDQADVGLLDAVHD